MKTKALVCSLIFAAGVACKWWLVSGMPITDDPDDSVNYVTQILFKAGLCFGPGTGYFGRLMLALGIPYRQGLELAYLTATLLIVKAFCDWPTRSVPALVLYLVMIFDPAPAELFSHLMSDPVWLVEILLGLALFMRFAEATDWRKCLGVIAAGVSLGFSTLTRNTFLPLMAALIAWLVIYHVALGLKHGKEPRKYAAQISWAICCYLIALIYFGTCTFNYRFQGYFGISVFDSYQYRQFYSALQSVGDPTGVPHYPIDEDRRQLIAQAGPVARRTMERMEQQDFFKKVALEMEGKYDLAPGWFEFAVLDSLNANRDHDKFFAAMREIENEIAQAGREGRIKVRPVLPLPDCRLGIVFSALPHAMYRLAGMISHEPPRYAWSWQNEPRFDNSAFSLALTRGKVTPSPARERIGEALCRVYAAGYAPLPGLFAVAFSLFVGGLIWRWKAIPAFSHGFLVRQIVLPVLLALYFWYVLFDASGLIGVPRYMLIDNVLLPLLIFYYGGHAVRLLRGDVSGL